MDKKYSMVDIGKIICAYIVVAIHTAAFSEVNLGKSNLNTYLNKYLFDFAVPFFFVSSGFFLGKKLFASFSEEEYCNILKQYFKRLFIPYCMWGGYTFLLVC